MVTISLQTTKISQGGKKWKTPTFDNRQKFRTPNFGINLKRFPDNLVHRAH